VMNPVPKMATLVLLIKYLHIALFIAILYSIFYSDAIE